MTSVRVLLPPPVVRSAEGITVSARTVAEALAAAATARPALAGWLRGPAGRLRPNVAVFVNGEDIRSLDGEGTRLSEGDQVELVPSLAGGDGRAEPPVWSPERLARYGRHLVLPGVGPEGQRRLAESSVLLVGMGGLGSPAALYLAAAGVGRLGLLDFDKVSTSNLQRQVLYTTGDVGRPKVEAAAERLAALNPEVAIEPLKTRISRENALGIVGRYDIVVDGTDNFPTRYLLNDAAVLTRRPEVFGSVYRFEGQVAVFDASRGPCYRCLFPEPPPPEAVPSCADGGVLGVLPGLVGMLQASEVLKLLLHLGEPLVGRLLLVDAASARFRELRLERSPVCPVCSEHPTVTELIDYVAFCGEVAPESAPAAVDVATLRAELGAAPAPRLVDVRSPEEYALGHLPGAVSMPLDRLADGAGSLAQAESVVVYCSGGVRAMQAARRLGDLGFRRVRRLADGIEGWTEAGGPLDSGPASP